MKSLAFIIAVLSGLLLSSEPAAATAVEFSRGQTTVTVGSNTITADNNVKYVLYTTGETITVTLHYSASCNIIFSGLTLRSPNPFTPRGVAGAIANVSGTPPSGGATTTGSVTFDIQFSALKQAAMKSFGVAHLNLVLGVDDDCSPVTGDADGVDGQVTIGVQISVSTVSHPVAP